ncbi:Endonuclease/exonuclease/phosphatase superfamily [Sesbania bispinosa]|nr:Endonuclease/exonuclease/phosphatase superfamily [Sesbania bispinosa]
MASSARVCPSPSEATNMGGERKTSWTEARRSQRVKPIPAAPSKGVEFTTATGMGLERKMMVEEENGSKDDTVEENGFLGDPLCPVVILSVEEREMIRIPWKRSLLVKVLGKRMGLRLDDLQHVFDNGPWMIANDYVVIQRWQPGFVPEDGNLQRVAEKEGPHGDFITEREKFARICIECGRYGHKKEVCSLNTRVDSNDDQAEEPQPNLQAAAETHQIQKTTVEVGTEGPTFGPWMIVQRNPRRNPQNMGGKSGDKHIGSGEIGGISRKSEEKLNAHKGSRFAALQVDNDNVPEEFAAEVQVAQKGRKQNHEGTSGAVKNVIKGAVKTLQRENVSGVGDQESLRSIMGQQKEARPSGSQNTAKGRSLKGQLKNVDGPVQNKARVGLNLKSQVKFKSVTNAARRGVSLADLPFPLIQENQFDMDLSLSSHGLGADEGVLVFNNRPPDTVQHGMVEEVLNSCSEGGAPDSQKGISLIAWNVWGAGTKSFPALIHDLSKKHNLDALAVFEPHVSGSKAHRMIRRLGFKLSNVVHANDFSGGIWILWNDKNYQLEVIQDHFQYVHIRVVPADGTPSWFLTCVYASPRPSIREELWHHLHLLASRMTKPWAVIGDFNSYLLRKNQEGLILIIVL